MAQKREKEATTELKLRPPTIPVPFPATRPSETQDPKLSENIETRPDPSTNSPDKKVNFAPTSDGSNTITSLKRPREVCRCSGSGCRKRVGLMGFRCRCGDIFCSEHRYSDRHDCGYDYKAAGRETIARENPVVKAAKLVKV